MLKFFISINTTIFKYGVEQYKFLRKLFLWVYYLSLGEGVIYTGNFCGSIVFLWTFPLGRCLFVFHSQHPHRNFRFEQASIFFLSFYSYGTDSSRGANYTSFFSLLFAIPAPSTESQHPESWPASIYGHLRESADFVGRCFVK